MDLEQPINAVAIFVFGATWGRVVVMCDNKAIRRILKDLQKMPLAFLWDNVRGPSNRVAQHAVTDKAPTQRSFIVAHISRD